MAPCARESGLVSGDDVPSCATFRPHSATRDKIQPLGGAEYFTRARAHGSKTVQRGPTFCVRRSRTHPDVMSPTITRAAAARSEEHTSELQSRLHLVCR